MKVGALPPAFDATTDEDRAGVVVAGRLRVGVVAARRHAGCEQRSGVHQMDRRAQTDLHARGLGVRARVRCVITGRGERIERRIRAIKSPRAGSLCVWARMDAL